jgi:hypothetical protein
MIKLIEFFVGLGMTVVISFFIVFIMINFMLNCQTWDQELWTAASSCVTLGQFIGVE